MAKSVAQINDEYTEKFIRHFTGIPKRIAARMVIAGYREALRATIQDSGRAAYNWHIKIGANDSFKKGDWYQQPNPHFKSSMRYEKSPRPGHPVGFPGEKRQFSPMRRKIVIDYKMSTIDFPNTTYGVAVAGSKNAGNFAYTKLFELITNSKERGKPGPGRMPKLTLYNPIWQAKNTAYVDNAFMAAKADKRIRKAILRAQSEEQRRLKRLRKPD